MSELLAQMMANDAKSQAERQEEAEQFLASMSQAELEIRKVVWDMLEARGLTTLEVQLPAMQPETLAPRTESRCWARSMYPPRKSAVADTRPPELRPPKRLDGTDDMEQTDPPRWWWWCHYLDFLMKRKRCGLFVC